MWVTVTEGGKTKTNLIESNYELFVNLYNSHNVPAPRNSEITGSQYIHRYVGSPGPATIYVKDLGNVADVAGIAAFLLAQWNVPASIISGVAGIIAGRMESNAKGADKIVVKSDTYEVLLRADNSYYIHCYHQTIEYYKEKESRPFITEHDYYQAIGG